MRVFTLDVGSGTQDFLFSDTNDVKTSIKTGKGMKAILPSPTKIIANKIKRSQHILLHGYTMGGGTNKKAAVEHAKKFKVFCTKKAALSFSDSLKKVESWGIKIVNSEEDVEEDVEKIEMKDVDWEFFQNILKVLDVNLSEIISVVAVQDHGFSIEKSNRKYRFELFEKVLKKGAALSDFLYEMKKVPEYYNRMKSVVESYLDSGLNGELYVVDTVFAAVAGCKSEVKNFPALLLNFGNSHFVGIIVNRDGEITSMFEHHTKVIKNRGKEWIKNFVEKFIRGEIQFEDVYKDGGHGAYVGEVVDVKEIISTGPRVDLSPFKIVSGDLMITGNIGMFKLLEDLV